MEWPISWEDVKKELESLKNATVPEDVLGITPLMVFAEMTNSPNLTATSMPYETINGLGENPKTYSAEDLRRIFEPASKVRIHLDTIVVEGTIANKVYTDGKLTCIGIAFVSTTDGVDTSGNLLIDLTDDKIRFRIKMTMLSDT